MATRDRKPKARPPGDEWFVYMMRCADDSLYTGITKDVELRCQQDNAGTASRYTRSRRPVELVYDEAQPSQRAGYLPPLDAAEGVTGRPGIRWTPSGLWDSDAVATRPAPLGRIPTVALEYPTAEPVVTPMVRIRTAV
jgi:GIY-YIG catalytic domain